MYVNRKCIHAIVLFEAATPPFKVWGEEYLNGQHIF